MVNVFYIYRLMITFLWMRTVITTQLWRKQCYAHLPISWILCKAFFVTSSSKGGRDLCQFQKRPQKRTLKHSLLRVLHIIFSMCFTHNSSTDLFTCVSLWCHLKTVCILVILSTYVLFTYFLSVYLLYQLSADSSANCFCALYKMLPMDDLVLRVFAKGPRKQQMSPHHKQVVCLLELKFAQKFCSAMSFETNDTQLSGEPCLVWRRSWPFDLILPKLAEPAITHPNQFKNALCKMFSVTLTFEPITFKT